MPNSANETMDLIWEVAEIAKLIGRTDRQTFHMLSAGLLPAKKVGGRWVCSRSKLIAFFMEAAA
ncbi:DNA-binding protein [Rhizobium sp. KVB221]|uniref:DNA-binding protein n=1 Tax=Rhizobium setariae TaxID=2801340 RepID=A0A936YNU0_9HYPH|nr:DNA-binding protein [Rhizobium setariae]MBL0374009.1 DNA-binding protein [Rhizobium setariae]